MSTAATDTEGREEMPREEIISRVLNVCSYWMTSFIKYSSWLENPSNVKAARFLSKGHAMLSDRMKELDIAKNSMSKAQDVPVLPESQEQSISGTEFASFDKSLESVEEDLVKLENLLQELDVSNSNYGKEDLKAACSDLEIIRRLKKEAEFLEASFRAKAEYMEADASNGPSSPDSEDGCGQTGSRPSEASVPSKSAHSAGDKRRPFWEIFGRPSERKVEPELQIADRNAAVTTEKSDMESNDILCFAQLRRELIELEKRVQKSANDAQEEVNDVPDEANAPSPAMSVPSSSASKKENAITKSVEMVKETTTTVVKAHNS